MNAIQQIFDIPERLKEGFHEYGGVVNEQCHNFMVNEINKQPLNRRRNTGNKVQISIDKVL